MVRGAKKSAQSVTDFKSIKKSVEDYLFCVGSQRIGAKSKFYVMGVTQHLKLFT